MIPYPEHLIPTGWFDTDEETPEMSNRLTETEARREYWRLQRQAEAMPQEQYESPEGDRLLDRQGELANLILAACGDPNWMFKHDPEAYAKP